MMVAQQKKPKKILWVVIFYYISLDIHLTVYQEHFVHTKNDFIENLTQNNKIAPLREIVIF